jgi:acetamidase/formamidase
MTVHQLEPRIYQYTYGPNKPALMVKNGDIVVVATCDAGGFNEKNMPISEKQKQRSEGTLFYQLNPLSGPIYVEEAEPGDMLAVTIQRIKLNRDYAWSSHVAHFGSLTGEGPGKTLLLNEPVPDSKFDWRIDTERNIGSLELKKSRLKLLEIPLHPFIGSIGVAPRFGRIEMALAPGEYGGNMDCIETKEGTILYLPVWVRGAYLALGDVHAAQGDGEVCGVALEISAEVTVKLEVIKGKSIDWPRLEDDTHIMTIGNGRPLMDCVRIAQIELVKWLVADYGFEKWEAFQAISQVSTMRIGNVCDPNYTIVAKFPKRYLPN